MPLDQATATRLCEALASEKTGCQCRTNSPAASWTVAIAVDATIVRMVLVPAVMQLLGERNWWLPRWLDRVIPEGALEGPAPAPAPAAG